MSREKFTIIVFGDDEVAARVRKLTPLAANGSIKVRATGKQGPGTSVSLPNLVIVDRTKGTSVPEAAIRLAEHTPVVLLVSEACSSDIEEPTGHDEYVTFSIPGDEKTISDHIAQAYNAWVAVTKKQQFTTMQQELYDFGHIVGQSQRLEEVLERARKIIKNNAMMVLITGETGTGKELFARAIHYNSSTKDHPFVEIACSALPENLLESELFGHERGAFTDAREKKTGLFELAGEGTIFLDEIGDISPAIQSKLLKVIEQRTMRRVGGIQEIPVRARIIAATSVDLEMRMRSGEFRPDLYHRLRILPMELPPLRDRMDDIPVLVESFLAFYNSVYSKKIRGITHSALQVLLEHSWDGNVRELKHCIERAVLLEDGSWLTETDFELSSGSGQQQRVAAPETETPPADSASVTLLIPIEKASVDNVQHLLVTRVLAYVRGNKLRASQILRISRPRLDRILRSRDASNRE